MSVKKNILAEQTKKVKYMEEKIKAAGISEGKGDELDEKTRKYIFAALIFAAEDSSWEKIDADKFWKRLRNSSFVDMLLDESNVRKMVKDMYTRNQFILLHEKGGTSILMSDELKSLVAKYKIAKEEKK